MVEVLVRSSHTALLTKRRMVLSAIPGAERASMELAPSAGSTANLASVMMVLSATSPRLTVVVLAMQYGTKISVSVKILISAVKSGELFGIPSAGQTFTMSLAVSVHQIAHLARLILASLALRTLMVVELDTP